MNIEQNNRYNTLLYIVSSVLLVASVGSRIFLYPIATSDYTRYYLNWFIELTEHPGLSAFRTPFSDYSPIYLYILKLLTLINVSSLYSIKTLSVCFDGVTAAFASGILRHLNPGQVSKAQRFFWFSAMFSIPTILINSSMWGQTDALYAAAIMGTAYYLFRERPIIAALVFALAFTVKLQSAFFSPVLLGCLLN